MRERSLLLMKLSTVVAVASCLLAGTANAQAVVKGRFTLPYEVRWGSAVLPAGQYSITMRSVAEPALVRSLTGKKRVFLLARFADDAIETHPPGLLITRDETGRVVRSFNWPAGGKNFVYKPFTKAERRRLAQQTGTGTGAALVSVR